MAAFAPIPRAIVAMATRANSGRLRRERMARRKSDMAVRRAGVTAGCGSIGHGGVGGRGVFSPWRHGGMERVGPGSRRRRLARCEHEAIARTNKEAAVLATASRSHRATPGFAGLPGPTLHASMPPR